MDFKLFKYALFMWRMSIRREFTFLAWSEKMLNPSTRTSFMVKAQRHSELSLSQIRPMLENIWSWQGFFTEIICDLCMSQIGLLRGKKICSKQWNLRRTDRWMDRLITIGHLQIGALIITLCHVWIKYGSAAWIAKI